MGVNGTKWASSNDYGVLEKSEERVLGALRALAALAVLVALVASWLPSFLVRGCLGLLRSAVGPLALVSSELNCSRPALLIRVRAASLRLH